MAGGKRRPHNKSKPRRPNPASSRSLFVEGGILDDFASPFPSHRGKRSSSNVKSRTVPDRANGSRSNSGAKKQSGNAFKYEYPAADLKGSFPTDSGSEVKDVDESFKELKPFVLLGSKDSRIKVYEDQMAPSEDFKVEYNYDYTSGFVLGESSHRGLGFSDEEEAAPELGQSEGDAKDESSHRGLGFSGKPDPDDSLNNEEVEAEDYLGFSSNVEETDAGEDMKGDDDSEMVQAFLDKSSSPAKNSGYLSIGGMRLYTEDTSEGEDDDGDGESSEDGSSSELSDGEDSEDSSDSGTDIDDEVVEDYLEGIGGGNEILDAKWLAKLDIDAPRRADDDEVSKKQMAGVALLEASREYGLKTPQSRKKGTPASSKREQSTVMWSSALDDLMLVKDPRRLSKKKKQVAQFPGSWPSGSRKSKSFRNYPGEKKKHRKEMMAEKRRERMIRRGVDLEQINLKLRDMVLRDMDIMSFQPMHTRDCTQVRKLASVYRLRSGCQGSGKKRFVIVSRTQHTSMPSAGDQFRLEKLIGSSKDDADFPVTRTPEFSGSGKIRPPKNSAGRNFSSEKPERKINGKKGPASYAAQPVAFVSSGVMESDTSKPIIAVDSSYPSNPTNESDRAIESSSSTNFAAFELHTKGFGSKMMAKMGYVEGGGLGKGGKGMAEPIEVTQRPKSLGLGIEFSETSNVTVPTAGRKESSVGAGRKESPRMGAFEKHTKGFGSKMMARMGFQEGMGLGRDSQGMVNPIAAVRRPKARGLGAERH